MGEDFGNNYKIHMSTEVIDVMVEEGQEKERIICGFTISLTTWLAITESSALCPSALFH